MSSECPSRRGLTALAVLLAALAVAPGVAAASAENKAAARQHLKQAEDLKKQGQLAEACKHLEEVEHLDPKLPTLMELAECTEEAGDLGAAQTWWALARDRAKHDEKPQSRARAEARLAAVQKRVAHLTLQLAAGSAGAQVLRDGVTLDAAALGGALSLAPGDHVIVVKLAGHDDAKFPVKLAEGDNQTLAIAAGPSSSSAAAPSTAPPPAPLAPVAPAPTQALPAASAPAAATKDEAPVAVGFWSSSHKAGALLGGVGLLGIGAGTALCVLAGKSDSTGDARLVGGGIAIAASSALFISGLVLLAGSGEDASQHAGVTVRPTLLVAREATALGAVGTF